MTKFSILFLCTVIGSVGCKGKSDGGPAAKGTDDKAAPAKSGPIKLDKLGLQIDVPGGADVGAGIGGGVMLQASSFGALTVDSPKTPQTLDEAKSDANMYTPKNLKADTLPDGWTLTFDNTGGAGRTSSSRCGATSVARSTRARPPRIRPSALPSCLPRASRYASDGEVLALA